MEVVGTPVVVACPGVTSYAASGMLDTVGLNLGAVALKALAALRGFSAASSSSGCPFFSFSSGLSTDLDCSSCCFLVGSLAASAGVNEEAAGWSALPTARFPRMFGNFHLCWRPPCSSPPPSDCRWLGPLQTGRRIRRPRWPSQSSSPLLSSSSGPCPFFSGPSVAASSPLLLPSSPGPRRGPWR